METSSNPAKDHSTNLVGIPTGLLASTAFNDFPQPLAINGVRQMNRSFFEALARTASAEGAAGLFGHYMETLFGLDGSALTGDEGAKRRYRSSYRRLLQGWGFDSNGPEGAVLKGWVESRFGLLPTFHKVPLQRFPAPEWMAYVEEKMSNRFHNNSISLQLDLLYEYGQWMLGRWLLAGASHVTLYRGVNDFGEHQIVERPDKRTAVVKQNSLVSFTSERMRADEFGDTILEASVPRVKILYCNGLLPSNPLKGEGEYLVIGGNYRVKVSYL
ncbi:MAG: NAD(+)--dinitrogen-reductase ADP-D-ribosyltransferase [Sulfuricella sp.]|nr:NAD(+)--dinitrogen-reductase ADP-D-ribosyltransferase [Sulfuricella sp.]